MSIPRTLNEAIYSTLHRSKKCIKEIADEVGKSESLLYRWASPESTTSHADLPLRLLLPILNSSNDNNILDYFELKRGRIAVKLPKGAASKLEEGFMVEHYQETTLAAVKALRTFLSDPSNETYKTVDDALKSVMAESASLDKYVCKIASGQFELKLKD